jgi:hypothetical protein
MFTRLLPVAVWLCGAPLAAQLDYFPLQTGNQWIYRSSTGSIQQVEVGRAAEFEGRQYYLIQGHPGGDAWLRRGEDGAVYAYDPEHKQELLWYDFWRAPGEPYATAVPGSNNSPAVVKSVQTIYDGPVGWFDWALEIEYPGAFQVGLYREIFLPFVGLLRRELGAGGPSVITWDLIYARLGGVTYINERNLSFGLTLDRFRYPAGSEMIARLTVRNGNWEPVTLEFPTSRIFDLTIRNSAGDTVYRWSEGKAFLQALRTETYGFGEKNYAVLAPLRSQAGIPFAPGRYVAEGRLTNGKGGVYAASAAFDIASLP